MPNDKAVPNAPEARRDLIRLQVWQVRGMKGPTIILGDQRIKGVEMSPEDELLVDTFLDHEQLKDASALWDQRDEARTPVTPQEIRDLADEQNFVHQQKMLRQLADQLERQEELRKEAEAQPCVLVPRDQLERNAEDANKVKAFNLLLTAVNPMVKQIAERYLEGVKDYDAFVEYLRKQPRPQPLQDADIDEDCR